mgnify:CR=1 FL=1
MSEVRADDLTEINTAQDVASLYTGVGKNNAKSGIEIELSFFDPSSDDLTAMSLCQNRVLKNATAAVLPDVDFVHNEPTSELLEVASFAASFKNMKSVMDDLNKKIKILSDKAENIGLKRSYFQELPDKTADELLSRIVDVERYKIMYAPYREDMRKCVQYFAVCKSNQVSVSPYDMDHMHKNIRRLYALAPFLFLLTDNSSAFSEGKPHAGHIGMTLRHAGLTEGRGGIPPYVFSAKSGEEFVNAHINHAMNNPLFMYYDRDGALNRVPSGDWGVTFNTLKQRGLNSASNYYLAQSILWPDVKVATLKDTNGAVTGHRYEARMFGVGMHQHQTAFIITNALAFHDDFAASIDDLLLRYGLDDYNAIMDSYKSARNHNGAFFNVAYGNGTMSEFAREFADLIEPVTDEMNITDEAAPMLHICRSGCTDGKVNRLLFPTLQDIKNIQRMHDGSMFENPNQCASMIFDREIKNEAGRLGVGACCG